MAARRRAVASCCLAALLPGCVQTPPPAVESGTVLAESPANQAGEDPGAGAIAGVVLGAAAGGALGRGAGRAIGVAVGGLVGGTAGAPAGAAVQTTEGIAYTVRLGDGRVTTIIQHLRDGEAVLPVGQAVRVETRGRNQHVVAS